jgi:tripartite-type tricarboxylate transporter receptor subunit TctC
MLIAISESRRPRRNSVRYPVNAGYGLLAPGGTSPAIVQRLNKELRQIVNSDDVKMRLISDGGGPMPSTPEEYAANIEREEGKWRALVNKLGLKIE